MMQSQAYLMHNGSCVEQKYWCNLTFLTKSSSNFWETSNIFIAFKLNIWFNPDSNNCVLIVQHETFWFHFCVYQVSPAVFYLWFYYWKKETYGNLLVVNLITNIETDGFFTDLRFGSKNLQTAIVAKLNEIYQIEYETF